MRDKQVKWGQGHRDNTGHIDATGYKTTMQIGQKTQVTIEITFLGAARTNQTGRKHAPRRNKSSQKDSYVSAAFYQTTALPS